MIKQIVRPIYKGVHSLLFNTIDANPMFVKKENGKEVKKGHISLEHLNDPRLDDKLVSDLKAAGISVNAHNIKIEEYHTYLWKANYPETYYGGGLDPNQNFTEKSLEHYVSTEFIDFKPDTVFIDVAACTSPFYTIVRELYGCKTTYQQDLIFDKGLKGDKIGGYGHEIPLEDESVNAVTLHCSLEHFENDSDTAFFVEMERVLKKGGRLVVLPFYIAYEFTNHVDPIYNLLKSHPIKVDKRARLRYCSWFQFFSRHYDVQALQERILSKVPNLQLSIYRVNNFRDVHEKSYLRFVGVFEKT